MYYHRYSSVYIEIEWRKREELNLVKIMSPNKQPSRTETIQQMANQSEAYRNFIDSINSEAFRYEYAKNIRYFLDFTGAGDYDSLLEIDQQQIETKIETISFIYVKPSD